MRNLSPKRTTGDVVRRAAGAGGAVDTLQHQSRVRFVGLVSAIVVAGFLMVGFVWSSRQYDHPTLFDSWENAYGVFDCTTDGWLEPVDSTNNPNGIRTRNDGVIYIEPSIESATGDGARLDVFLDNVGASLTSSDLTLPSGQVLSAAGATCDGQEAVLQVQRWDASSLAEPVEVVVDTFDNIVFREDGQSFTIALAPLGAAVSAPPSATRVAPVHQSVQAPFDNTADTDGSS